MTNYKRIQELKIAKMKLSMMIDYISEIDVQEQEIREKTRELLTHIKLLIEGDNDE